MTRVHVILPAGFDDPTRPSGGNQYDRRLVDGLIAGGWDVRVHAVAGSWPHPDHDARAGLRKVVLGAADDDVVLVDGLVASVVPGVLVPAARRLRLVVLVHMPQGDDPSRPQLGAARAAEGAVLAAARAVVTTSRWARDRLIELYGLRQERVFVAAPGVDAAELSPGTADGGALLCVAAVAPHKGHDVLLAALSGLGNCPWRCTCIGALDREPAYVERLERQMRTDGIANRVSFVGVRSRDDLDRAYADADALVVPSRYETYGMVITEALARGLPVIASAVGGVPEALGATGDGRRPGRLVPADDPGALRATLLEWLGDRELRDALRTAAHEVRADLRGWDTTTGAVAAVLARVEAEPWTSPTRVPV